MLGPEPLSCDDEVSWAEFIIDRVAIVAAAAAAAFTVARAWAEYKKAKCETCAAALVLASSCAEEEECEEQDSSPQS
jgi:hypothetical protein